MAIDLTTIPGAPFLIPLFGGYLLDMALGDPPHLLHPIRIFGEMIAWMEKHLNHGKLRFIKGMMTAIILIATVWITFHLFFSFIKNMDWLWYPVATIMVYYGLANRNLIDEARKVETALRNDGVEAGRKQLSFIVGRDTTNLTPNQIRTATLETLSENLSDGVIAPLFYYAIGGIPLMFAYKMINTLDSMIGYKNDRFFYFGKFAARLDDLANYLPARITALLMILVTAKPGLIRCIIQNRKNHASPNSGWPEAALAGILNCRFGGPNEYHGTVVNKPFIGHNNREITSHDISKASHINHLSTIAMILLISGCLMAWHLFL